MTDGRKNVELIGIYYVDNRPDVSLVELIISKKAGEIDLFDFTQEITDLPRESWQVPFYEKYLDEKGEIIIGDDFDLPSQQTEITRLTFFIYYLDFLKPLQTPYGSILLPKKVKAPERIAKIIFFEDPE